MDDNIKTLANMIDDAKRIVFSVAGVSPKAEYRTLEARTAYTEADGKIRLKLYSAGAILTEIPQNSLNFTEKRHYTPKLSPMKRI